MEWAEFHLSRVIKIIPYQVAASAYELKIHRKTCFWACPEVGCQKKGETRKRQIDKHERKHEADKQKLARLSQFMLEP